MLRLLLGCILLMQGVCGKAADTLLENTRQLNAALQAGRQPLTLEAMAAVRGCGPKGCSIDFGPLSIRPNKAMLTTVGGKKPIMLKTMSQGPQLALDWEALAGYRVKSMDQTWGACLEFTHKGLGKSGQFQRWVSVVLVPWLKSKPGQTAFHFMGYWASCSSLVAGTQAGRVSLPTLEMHNPAKPEAMTLYWHDCTGNECSTNPDLRSVSRIPHEYSEALRLDAPQ